MRLIEFNLAKRFEFYAKNFFYWKVAVNPTGGKIYRNKIGM